jgi:DNA-binding transcriptional LysR family regulator
LPLIAERVASIDLMMALVSAGFALGLTGASQIAASRELDVIARPLTGRSTVLTTYLLCLDGAPSESMTRFIELEINNIGRGPWAAPA